jgi:hypothetical protein
MERGRGSKLVVMNAAKKHSMIAQRIVQERGAQWQHVEAASRLVPIANASRKGLMADIAIFSLSTLQKRRIRDPANIWWDCCKLLGG